MNIWLIDLNEYSTFWLCRDIFPGNVRLYVHNDAIAALASGTMGKLHGCVLIAGTGTIAYGFTEDGRDARAAGAGPILGDWGRYLSFAHNELFFIFFNNFLNWKFKRCRINDPFGQDVSLYLGFQCLTLSLGLRPSHPCIQYIPPIIRFRNGGEFASF